MEPDRQPAPFSWSDYAATMAAARGLGGREYLEAMRAGRIAPPPFVDLLGFGLTDIADGRVVFTLVPQPAMLNGIGLIHGGVAATICDTAVGCACLTLVPASKVAVTIDLQVRYFKPLTLQSGTVRCEGTVLNVGRTIATAQAQLFDESGRLCCHATSSLALVEAAAAR